MPKFRIGTDDYKKLRDNGGYFVDKTLFIKEIIDGNDVTLIPRPRRFGKTLNMTMLRYFFEKTEDDRAYLFNDCAIAKYPEYMEHQGKYPLIYISLKDVKGSTWEESRERLSEKIGELIYKADYLKSTLPTIYKSGFDAISSRTADDAILKASLKNLIEWLYEYHKKHVIVLIDEYDSPMIEAWTNGYYQEMAEFMRSWLGAGLKHENSQALYRGVVTGILRIAKESIFSELNNLKVSTTLQQNNLASMFGFTQEEIDSILIDFDLPELGSSLREWYNGYLFGNHVMYNPWSVTNCVDNHPAPPAPHWLNTSSNALVYKELAVGGLEIKRDLELLLDGGELRYPLSDTITFSDIGKNPMNIWSFLFYSGYLTAHDPKPNIRGRITYLLSIPNREISYAYENFIESLFVRTDGGLDALMKCFLGKQPLNRLESILQELTLEMVSMYDLAKLPEAVFHAFVLGLLADLRNIYEIRSNAETGYGRADILMIPKNQEYPAAYVIEFKTIDSDNNEIKKRTNALDQIRKKEYSSALKNAGVKDDKIINLAIILHGKKVSVEIDGDYVNK